MVRSGALLLAGRQVGAAAFIVAVVALPRLLGRPTFNNFMWAYVIELFVSSVLSLGLERMVAGAVAAEHPEHSRLAVSWAVTIRTLTLPLTAAAVLTGLWVVHVRLPWAAIVGVVVWTAAIQYQTVMFAVLRAMKRIGIEPASAAVVRLVQAVALIGAAHAGASLSTLVFVVAVPEVALAVVLWRKAASGVRLIRPKGFPWREVTQYSAIEISGFAYLRADALVVGNILGPGSGATYSLAYRVVDGLTATITPFLLHLFPAAARAASQPEGVNRLRRTLLPKAPLIASAASLATMFAAVKAGDIVPRLGEGRAALQVLVVTVPLYAFSAIELHLRSAEGRNRVPVALGATLLVFNVALNLVFVARYGMVAAAWVLVACELAQATYLAAALVRAGVVDFGKIAPGATAVALLGVTAGLLAISALRTATVSAAVCLIACAWPWLRRSSRPELAVDTG